MLPRGAPPGCSLIICAAPKDMVFDPFSSELGLNSGKFFYSLCNPGLKLGSFLADTTFLYWSGLKKGRVNHLFSGLK